MTAVLPIYTNWGVNKGTKAQLRAIVPDSISVTWQLNQFYEASLTVWDDGSEAFNMVAVQNSIIIDGQEFVIKQVEPDYSGGITTYSVSLIHLFYEIANSTRMYNGNSIRWKRWDGQIINPNASEGRTVDQIDLTKSNDDSSTTSSTNETLTSVTLDRLLDLFGTYNIYGHDKIHLHGDFPQESVNINQDLETSDVWSLITSTWSDLYIIPNNGEVDLYTEKEFFKDHGNRIDYLHDTEDITLTYDTTTLTNAARLIGATYEVVTGSDSSDGGATSSEGAGAEPVNGDWTPVIKLAAYMMDVSITDANIQTIKAQIQLESSGNEKAVQGVWDINMANGNPAKGLLQFIPQTFMTYAVEGYTNIFKGLDQLLAFFNIPGAVNQITGTHGWSPQGAKRMNAPAHPANGQSGTSSSSTSKAQEVINYAKQNVGKPYVWGGPRGVDQVVGTDCSGLTSNIYKHFGITIGTVTYTQCNDGTRISRSQVQTGDLGFYDPGPHHVVMALNNQQAIQQPEPGEVCNIFNIDSYQPSYWIRNAQMAALVGGDGGMASTSDSGSSTSTVTVSYFTPFYYINEDSKKLWGERPTNDITSDTIMTEDEMKKYADTQLKLNPTFSMDVTTQPGRQIPMGDITRVKIESNGYVASLKMVSFTYYPYSQTAQSTFTYNSKPASILDFYHTQQNMLSGVQSRIETDLSLTDRSKRILKSLQSGETSDQTSSKNLVGGGDNN